MFKTNQFQLNDCLPSIRQVLSSNNFPGELDLFSREKFRLMLIDLFTVILSSIRDCIENLLQLRYFIEGLPVSDMSRCRKKQSMSKVNLDPNFSCCLITVSVVLITTVLSRSDMRRPSALAAEGTVSNKKLLISICNVEYVLGVSLPALCRRLADNGMKYGDVIFEVSHRVQFHQFCAIGL